MYKSTGKVFNKRGYGADSKRRMEIKKRTPRKAMKHKNNENEEIAEAKWVTPKPKLIKSIEKVKK